MTLDSIRNSCDVLMRSLIFEERKQACKQGNQINHFLAKNFEDLNFEDLIRKMAKMAGNELFSARNEFSVTFNHNLRFKCTR